MQTMAPKRYQYQTLPRVAAAMAGFIAMSFLPVSPARAAGPAEQQFSSPQQAVAALAAAVEKNDVAGLLAILGPGSEELISSGDKVADQKGRARFLKAYREKNRLEQEQDGRTVLIIGDKDFPFPIPIVREEEGWRFDTAAGREEILDRRIGRNELHTIEVMRAYTDAQRRYACQKCNGDSSEFAQKFASSPGKKDGLYWATGEGEQESPFGPMIAKASAEGYSGSLDGDAPEPFHGYLFKILKAQGSHAEGGAFDYVVNGRMILGFALVAYPACYGASGIMTFIVNQEGVIYEKDLGDDTASVVAAMTAYDPDDTWRKYLEPAGGKAPGAAGPGKH
jgi:Protein of unknown function (DUF2950)